MTAPENSRLSPEGLRLARNSTGLVITVSWRNMASWAIVPIALMSNAIAVAIFYKLRDVRWNDPLQLLTLVFGVVGIVYLYIAIRRLINVTRLEITPKRITINHGPLPWRSSSEVAAETISKIEVRPHRWRYKGSEVTHYHVWAVQEHGSETCLLERDTTVEQANHVRDEIQLVLEIKAAAKLPEMDRNE